MKKLRRQVHLLVPFFILAVSFIVNNHVEFAQNWKKYNKYLFIILLCLPISYYLASVYGASQINIWFDFTTDAIAKLRTKHLLIPLLPLGLYLCYLYVYGKKRLLDKILITSFICMLRQKLMN